MSVPPNALAAFSIWGTVWLSARYKVRAPFIIGSAVIAIMGIPTRLLYVPQFTLVKFQATSF